MGDLDQKSVLDLACGEGIYSRKIKNLSAAVVTGVDISPKMIELAEIEENKKPIGITYRVGDVTSLEKIGEFDFALGAYLLCYAQSSNQLTAMCKSIYRNLKLGGKFIGVTDNSANLRQDGIIYRKYGFTRTFPSTQVEGAPIEWVFFNADGSEFKFNNFYLSREVYEQSFRKAGFRNLEWVHPVLAEGGISAMGAEYWSEFMDSPPIHFLRAEK